ncbi:phosphate ABC transporter permease PstA [Nocardioides sp. B-3]|uniref:phosphate ABC transporter permease PstA n=1 Tax=Nocardioides sp. B-3 TaxID=2895565 RepID=UPI0021527191|nr:phosphate ABC transporter permease PstA [Nocardioides sp. B-3]UUZ57616.1 phosphate ABC transporter permease PstA [Nocardioides sp. B-3]
MIDFFGEVAFSEFFSFEEGSRFAVLPLISATLMTTLIALLVAVPLGLGAAMYLSEYASARARKILKPTVELPAGVPSVVYGFFAVMFVTPTLLQDLFGLEVSFLNALSAGPVLGVMIIPTIASLAEDALSAVPHALRQGSLAMGANRMQTTLRVVLPAALSGCRSRYRAGAVPCHRRDHDRHDRCRLAEELVPRPAGGHADHDRLHGQHRGWREPRRLDVLQHTVRRRTDLVRDHPRHQHHQHRAGPSLQAGILMSIATTAAQDTTVRIATGKSRDRNVGSMVFPGALWFSLFFGVMVPVVLIVDTAIAGAHRFDADLLTSYDSTLFPERTGFRAGILGSLWLMLFTAVMAVPPGIAAALYLEEFADGQRWYNRLIEVNLQNLAAVPTIVYGLLAVAVMASMGIQRKGIVLGRAIALALLILPVIIITTREAVRAVPRDIRDGSLAPGATTWQTTWRQTLPSAVPGIATGTIPGLSRAIGEAAPLVMLGLASSLRFDPEGVMSPITALPIQIYGLSSSSQDAYKDAASAAIIVLLVMILGLNALAIFIRNKFQRSR